MPLAMDSFREVIHAAYVATRAGLARSFLDRQQRRQALNRSTPINLSVV